MSRLVTIRASCSMVESANLYEELARYITRRYEGLECKWPSASNWSILPRIHRSSWFRNYVDNNRLYIGWFGVIMIPMLFAATIVFVIAFIAASSSSSRLPQL